MIPPFFSHSEGAWGAPRRREGTRRTRRCGHSKTRERAAAAAAAADRLRPERVDDAEGAREGFGEARRARSDALDRARGGCPPLEGRLDDGATACGPGTSPLYPRA